MTDFKRIENADAQSWLNIFAAASDEYREKYGLRVHEVDGVWVATCKKIPFPHFNQAINLGLNAPFTLEILDAVLQVFKNEGIGKFYIHHTEATEPADSELWLLERGLHFVSAWDRIVRDDTPLSKTPIPSHFTIENVNQENAKAWASFIDTIYGMPTSEWLLDLVGLEGWHHAFCIENNTIIAARSMHINPDNTAYMMIDAPVPGIMTQRFEPDYFVTQQLVEIGLSKGVKLFASDIEKPSPTRDSTAYNYWARLGFEPVYLKKNYML